MRVDKKLIIGATSGLAAGIAITTALANKHKKKVEKEYIEHQEGWFKAIDEDAGSVNAEMFDSSWSTIKIAESIEELLETPDYAKKLTDFYKIKNSGVLKHRTAYEDGPVEETSSFSMDGTIEHGVIKTTEDAGILVTKMYGECDKKHSTIYWIIRYPVGSKFLVTHICAEGVVKKDIEAFKNDFELILDYTKSVYEDCIASKNKVLINYMSEESRIKLATSIAAFVNGATGPVGTMFGVENTDDCSFISVVVRNIPAGSESFDSLFNYFSGEEAEKLLVDGVLSKRSDEEELFTSTIKTDTGYCHVEVRYSVPENLVEELYNFTCELENELLAMIN